MPCTQISLSHPPLPCSACQPQLKDPPPEQNQLCTAGSPVPTRAGVWAQPKTASVNLLEDLPATFVIYFFDILGEVGGETLENTHTLHTDLSKTKHLGMLTGTFNRLCRKPLTVQTCNFVSACLPNRAKNSNDSINGVWNAFLPCFPTDWRQLMHLYLSKLKKKIK